MNHYMFVDRDHWYGAPLAKDGTISSGYEVIRQFNSAILGAKIHELDNVRKICVVGNRQYQWLRLLDNPKQFEYVEQLMSDAMTGVCRDLMRLKLDYDIARRWMSSGSRIMMAVILPTRNLCRKVCRPQ